MVAANIGAACFGLVIGWIVYRTLRRREGPAALSDISAVIGAIGGAGVTTVFANEAIFGLYCIGLAVGFFSYFVTGLLLARRTPSPSTRTDRAEKPTVDEWMGD